MSKNDQCYYFLCKYYNSGETVDTERFMTSYKIQKDENFTLFTV